jgi:hypothetical protein
VHPIAAVRQRRAIRPGTPTRASRPRPACFGVGMTAPPRDFTEEPAPAREAPDTIPLPDLSQFPPLPPPQPGRHTGRMKGRHFGPRPVKDPLSARFNVRCPPEFFATLQAEAEAARLSLSAYVCAKLGGSPGPRAHRSKPGPDAAAEARIVAALGRSGSNLNQLLRQVNAYDFRGHPELLEMCAELKAAAAAHHELVEAIKAERGL